MQRVYRNSTRVFGTLMVVLGVALVASTIARGGGPLTYGVVVGVCFTLLGVGRLYLTREQ